MCKIDKLRAAVVDAIVWEMAGRGDPRFEEALQSAARELRAEHRRTRYYLMPPLPLEPKPTLPPNIRFRGGEEPLNETDREELKRLRMDNAWLRENDVWRNERKRVAEGVTYLRHIAGSLDFAKGLGVQEKMMDSTARRILEAVDVIEGRP